MFNRKNIVYSLGYCNYFLDKKLMLQQQCQFKLHIVVATTILAAAVMETII